MNKYDAGLCGAVWSVCWHDASVTKSYSLLSLAWLRIVQLFQHFWGPKQGSHEGKAIITLLMSETVVGPKNSTTSHEFLRQWEQLYSVMQSSSPAVNHIFGQIDGDFCSADLAASWDSPLETLVNNNSSSQTIHSGYYRDHHLYIHNTLHNTVYSWINMHQNETWFNFYAFSFIPSAAFLTDDQLFTGRPAEWVCG